jgi:uncharacterized protein (UPF0212 family)
MHTLTAAELLQAWEAGLDQPLGLRGLLLLAPACPELNAPDLAALPIGQRDSLLLTLREQTFGPRLTALADCPACGGHIELEFNAADIRAQPSQLPENAGAVEYTLVAGGINLQFRLPNSRDLAETASIPNSGRQNLLERVILSAEGNGQPIAVADLSEPVILAVAEEMARLDSQADIQVRMTCPECAHQWAEAFDILQYFWEEVQSWSLRLLREVHTLAATYGWREADILSMSPRRRQLYLHMISS